MISVKIRFKESSVEGKAGCLYYQVICRRVVRQVNTGYRIFSHEWDAKMKVVKVSKDGGCDDDGRSEYIRFVCRRIGIELSRFHRISVALDNGIQVCTVDDIVERFLQASAEQSLSYFMREMMTQLRDIGKYRTAEIYKATLNSFVRFAGKDVILDEIDSDFMVRYEAYLKLHDISMNTISFYMRVLRAVYNRAVEKGLTVQKSPFRHVYTGIGKTVKRGMSIAHVRKIKELCLPANSTLDFARDIFMFSFYTRGMSFVDIAYLKKSDLKNGILTYKRRKTGQQLMIKWERCMQDIVNKYQQNPTEYLFPIIRHQENPRKQYDSALHLVNCQLKKIAKQIRLPIKLTTYVARHSWAGAARINNIPLSVISEGMGHDSENTTKIYLASLDASVIDKANELILKSI